MVKHSTLDVQNSPLGTANTEEAQSKNNSINLSIQQRKAIIHENKQSTRNNIYYLRIGG